MDESYIKLYEEFGATQDAFGHVDGTETLLFESDATVDQEGITVSTGEGGFTRVGDLTVYPNTRPDYSQVELEMKAEVTTSQGDTIIGSVAKVQPKGAFNGAIVINR